MKIISEETLFEKHKKERCSKCKINIDCEIHKTLDGKTRCTYDERDREKLRM